MNDSSSDPELLRLLDALANESITPADHAALQELLRHRPDAQETYFAFMDLHLGLQRIARARDAAKTDRPGLQAACDVVPTTHRPRSSRAAQWSMAAIVAGLLIAAFGLSTWHSQDANHSNNFAVRVTQTAGAAFFNESTPTSGGSLTARKTYTLTRGVIELRFPRGERVIVDGPAIFEIVGEQHLSLRTGSCSVDSPAGVTGFMVDTPTNQVVDLGTRLSVNVGETGVTDIQVEEGAAEVRSAKTVGTPTKLLRGEAIRFGFGEAPAPESVDYDGSRYRATLPDRVVAYRAKDSKVTGATDLVDITVQRGGEHRHYPVGELIGVEMIHFRGGANLHNLIAPPGFKGTRTDVLSKDVALNTAPANPGGSREPLTTDPVLAVDNSVKNSTPGLGVRFRRPVVNDLGPDVVFFELQATIHPLTGDPFHVSPLRFASGLRSHSVARYDIDLYSPAALTLAEFGIYRFASTPKSLADFLSVRADLARQHIQFRGLCVGIDLSDLGYADGAAVDGLFFQDASDGGDVFDPVFIGGLPPLKPNSVPDTVSTPPRSAL